MIWTLRYELYGLPDLKGPTMIVRNGFLIRTGTISCTFCANRQTNRRFFRSIDIRVSPQQYFLAIDKLGAVLRATEVVLFYECGGELTRSALLLVRVVRDEAAGGGQRALT